MDARRKKAIQFGNNNTRRAGPKLDRFVGLNSMVVADMDGIPLIRPLLYIEEGTERVDATRWMVSWKRSNSNEM